MSTENKHHYQNQFDFGHVVLAKDFIIPQVFIIALSGVEYFLLDEQSTLREFSLSFNFGSEVRIRRNISSRGLSNSSLHTLNFDVIDLLENVRIRFDTTCVFRERLIVSSMAMNLANLVQKRNADSSLIDEGGRKKFGQRVFLDHHILMSHLTFANMEIHSFNGYISHLKNILSLATINKKIEDSYDFIFEIDFDAHLVTIHRPHILEKMKKNTHNEAEMSYYDFKRS